ncbi:MAG: hypothetical protein ACE361_17580 [Aureliella sp.]
MDPADGNPYKPTQVGQPTVEMPPGESPLEQAARSLFIQFVAAVLLLTLLFFPLWLG